MEKMVSKGLKQPFFSCCGCRNPTGKQGQNGLQKCLQVKARHQTCRANPSNPRSAGIFPAPRLASKTEGCHQAGHLPKGRNGNALRKCRIPKAFRQTLKLASRGFLERILAKEGGTKDGKQSEQNHDTADR